MARISYTEKEVELLARLIKSEALGEGEEGKIGRASCRERV